MNRKILFSMLAGLAAASLLSAGEGETLFNDKCAMCHSPKIPKEMKSLVAPPAEGIAMHVKMAHPEKKAFVAFVTDYVLHPSADKALCEGMTVKRFGIMPSQKGNVSEEELKKIAAYLYDHYALGGQLKKKHEMMKQRFERELTPGSGIGGKAESPKQGKIRMH